MYLVGVIPGPGKPKTDWEINHFLRPLVDELLQLWNSGIYYSRTSKYVGGRLVRCVLVPLVCDLPAARQVGGFGSYSAAYFCHMCNLRKEDMNELDMDKWGTRTCEDHREAAEAWKDMPSVAKRKSAFKLNSTRWSALLDLPYWDPIRFTVIDSMHNHYLGLLQDHCREIWGMNTEVDEEHQGAEEGLQAAAASETAVSESATSERAVSDIAASETSESHIHTHLRDTQLPSWVNPVPTNVGTKSRGKLSADQWHVFCVVNLPIILIPLWYHKSQLHRERLDNYMDLVTEVVVGSLLEMSEPVIKIYEEAAFRYLHTAKRLYNISITPNQHNSLHIPSVLRLFGPLHAIRTFFSERMNLDLQSENTNMKFGAYVLPSVWAHR
ncbi:hypothetical protein L226DRAFT_458088 [Lentinus tigrinus ALCF2SS1-7]|uniref:uncharacterized protein n=1 Tax=Lentinus tigrinus ALCF2SS1-7 TaxID=1328758 RepID=UPI001166362E|nr:hypothetical protein L226DRAFT_458088 [Lentinus tigrinus ALCF2SS1-7]